MCVSQEETRGMSSLLDKADDCRELAKECFDLAGHATDARTRGRYQKRAQDYLARVALLTKTWSRWLESPLSGHAGSVTPTIR